MLDSFTETLDGINFEYTKISYNLSEYETEELFLLLRETEPDLILTLGPGSSRIVSEKIIETPVVFSMLNFPRELNIIDDLIRPGGNVTGVTLDIPPAVQFEILAEALPHIEKIGIAYNPENTGRTVEEAEEALLEAGLGAVTETVKEPRDLSRALDNLKEKGADIIWTLPDRSLYFDASIRRVLLFSLRNRIPVTGYSKNFVSSGAFMGIYPDYGSVGQKTAETVLRIMEGEHPGEIPVYFTDKPMISFNRRAIATIGNYVAEEVLQRAEEIIE